MRTEVAKRALQSLDLPPFTALCSHLTFVSQYGRTRTCLLYRQRPGDQARRDDPFQRDSSQSSSRASLVAWRRRVRTASLIKQYLTDIPLL
jgi:hypothetical protein